jgi:DNA invertase Pin-like site-specific DNA recombinase
MRQIAYRRVSTVEQNTDRQLAESGMSFDLEFEDKCSGSTANRPELTNLRIQVRAGDVVHVHSIDRMARSLQDLNALVAELNEKSVAVRFHKEGLDFNGKNNATSNLMLNIIGSIAEFERTIIRERQAEGIAKAKAKGVYKGAKRKADRTKVLNMVKDGIPKAQIARKLGIGRTTVYDIINERA